jgi:Tol biopolymer transport system component
MTVDNNTDVFTAMPDGSDLHRLTTQPGFDACAAWSPDRTFIAYCSDQSGVNEIWTMRADGTQQMQLTNLGTSAIFPSYSPDGTGIAFQATSPDSIPNANDIYVINVDGTGLVNLTPSKGEDEYPVWSPDGSQVAFVSQRGGLGQVWVMNADGSEQRQLTTDPANKDVPVDWSPDGTTIVYMSEGTGSGDIYIMNADGSNSVRLTDDPLPDLAPTWSPDGSQIAYLHMETDGRPLYVMNADGSDQHPVELPGKQIFAPDW